MLRTRRSTSPATQPGSSQPFEATARLDRRTKNLIPRARPGDIAIISHPDLDRIAAEGLVEKKVAVVVNAAQSSTGHYPNLGPLVLTGAGVHLVDSVGETIFEAVREGETLRVIGGQILKAGKVVAEGRVLGERDAARLLDEAKAEISHALEDFAQNTLSYIANERDFLIEAIHLPELRTEFAGRHVLVVVRGYEYKQDLQSLHRGYIREFRPVLVAVDGAADAMLDLKLKPDIIIGDMDSVSTQALSSGAELIVHAYADGRAPGKKRLDALGLGYRVFEAPGTSEDVALLMAHEKGAELIVAVGARASLVELLDKGRRGMASTFLVRLRVGPKLVDAKGVSKLHRGAPTRWELFGLVMAAVFAMVIIVAISQPMRLVLEVVVDWFNDLWFSIRQGLF